MKREGTLETNIDEDVKPQNSQISWKEVKQQGKKTEREGFFQRLKVHYVLIGTLKRPKVAIEKNALLINATGQTMEWEWEEKDSGPWEDHSWKTQMEVVKRTTQPR